MMAKRERHPCLRSAARLVDESANRGNRSPAALFESTLLPLLLALELGPRRTRAHHKSNRDADQQDAGNVQQMCDRGHGSRHACEELLEAREITRCAALQSHKPKDVHQHAEPDQGVGADQQRTAGHVFFDRTLNRLEAC